MRCNKSHVPIAMGSPALHLWSSSTQNGCSCGSSRTFVTEQKLRSQGLTGFVFHRAAASNYTQTYLIAYSRKWMRPEFTVHSFSLLSVSSASRDSNSIAPALPALSCVLVTSSGELVQRLGAGSISLTGIAKMSGSAPGFWSCGILLVFLLWILN